ncbi:hypothetical protein EON81_13840 [bacterium]|nr:MAG: hypothetical protein EON81_13840 [bacterium]
MKRIVYTMALGRPKFAECALGLARSLRLIGDTTPRVIVTDLPNYPWERYFDEVLVPTEPAEMVYFAKLTALERTDADQVLWLDGDMLAFRRLDDIFDACAGKGFAVQGTEIDKGDWYGSVTDHCTRLRVPSLPRFNGGMIYYERTPETQRLISTVRNAMTTDGFGFPKYRGGFPEEPVVAAAMRKEGIGHVFPESADFHNSATGLIGSLRLDVQNNECSFVCRRDDVRFVRPYVFHASRYINYTVYWRQLAALEKLERYEDQHGYGWLSPGQKLRRSVERRYLKWVLKKL